MYIVGIILFLVLIIFIRLKMPMWKGKYSEKLVNNKIQELPEEYVIFND
ncbi:topoisomerase I, partial [Bacteroides ovatus]